MPWDTAGFDARVGSCVATLGPDRNVLVISTGYEFYGYSLSAYPAMMVDGVTMAGRSRSVSPLCITAVVLILTPVLLTVTSTHFFFFFRSRWR